MKQYRDIQRRAFLKAATVIPGASALGLAPVSSTSAELTKSKLDILFLGGTGFIGPHTVRKCLQEGHSVTLFNRGKRNAGLFPELETIVGNRDPEIDSGLEGLKGRRWDVVIDTSGYIPRHVSASANLLKNAASQYLFISTVSVYSDFSIKDMTENATLTMLDDPSVETITGETYGGLKVLCENAVTRAFGENATILRPTYIVGPGDHTDRFIHYIHRPLLGGRMAIPGKPSNPVSYIDVRDLAKFIEHAVANKVTGIYNTVEKPKSANFGELIETSIALSQSQVKTTWIDGKFLAAQRESMGEKSGMFPIWHDQDNAEFAGTTSQAKAAAVGLTNRAFKNTVTDTYNWWLEQTQSRRDNRRIHITQEFEQALLVAWDKSSKRR